MYAQKFVSIDQSARKRHICGWRKKCQVNASWPQGRHSNRQLQLQTVKFCQRLLFLLQSIDFARSFFIRQVLDKPWMVDKPERFRKRCDSSNSEFSVPFSNQKFPVPLAVADWALQTKKQTDTLSIRRIVIRTLQSTVHPANKQPFIGMSAQFLQWLFRIVPLCEEILFKQHFVIHLSHESVIL